MLELSIAVFSFVASVQSQTMDWIKTAHKVYPPQGYSSSMAFDGVRGEFLLYVNARKGGIQTWAMRDNRWTRKTQANAYAPLHGQSMVYDAARAEIIMHGGYKSAGTWAWSGSKWVRKVGSKLWPRPTFDYSATYDSGRKRVVIYGGYDSRGILTNDTWEWDGTNWAKTSTSNSPGFRYRHAMAYDAVRKVTILFGGMIHGTPAKAGNDTWAYDAKNWKKLSPKTSPKAREEHRMVFDSARQRIVLFGGSGMNDTWTWDGANWKQENPVTAPAGRRGHAMAYSKTLRQTMIFGGTGIPFGENSNTWKWEPYRKAGVMPYGSGCGTFPGLVLEPSQNALPVLNQGFSLRMKGMSPSVTAGLLVLGLSKSKFGSLSLPLDLTGFGMKGCSLLQSFELQFVFSAFQGVGTYSLAVPYMPALKGKSVYLQVIAADSKANILGLVTSNGLRATFGYR